MPEFHPFFNQILRDHPIDIIYIYIYILYRTFINGLVISKTTMGLIKTTESFVFVILSNIYVQISHKIQYYKIQSN